MKALFFVPPFLLLVAFICGSIRYKFFDTKYRILFLYILFSLIADIISYVTRYYSINNLWLFHVFTPIEFLFLSLFYMYFFNELKISRYIIIIQVLFVAFCLTDSIYLNHVTMFNSYSRGLESLFISVFSVLGYYAILKREKITELSQYPFFWINTALFMRFTGMLLLYILSNYILTFNKSISMTLWTVHACFSIIMYSLLTYGIWMIRNK